MECARAYLNSLEATWTWKPNPGQPHVEDWFTGHAAGHGWAWPAMALHDPPWPAMAGMADHGWAQSAMAGHAMVGHGWP